MQPHARIRPTTSAVYRRVGGEGGVILHLETKDFFQLNEVGAAVWSLVEAGTTFARLVTDVRGVVEGAPPELQEDLATFVSELEARGLVIVEDTNAVRSPS